MSNKSNLVLYAEQELKLLGSGGMQDEMNAGILKIVEVFSEEDHSGFSAAYATSILDKLLRFRPLTPLTGQDDEWVDVCDEFYQNKRCSTVFKDKKTGQSYNIDGRVFREPNGACFINSDSRVYVTFPYEPKTEYVDRN